MTDTHCHVTFPQYDGDRDAVLSRAADAGVRTIVNPGTDLAQSRAAVELATSRSHDTPRIFAGIGVHPHDVGKLTEDDFAIVAGLAHDPHVAAVGEVGLERSPRSPALELQQQWLARFVQLGREVQKPLLFHVRDAHAEFRAFLDVAGSGLHGVVHCFSGSLDDARWYVERGLFLGMTGIVTFPNAEGLRAIVREIPLESLLLETDAPFLAPQAYRGKRNEPAHVQEVAREVARVKETAVPAVERVTDANASRLFGW
ncbi:MAG: TatD DNase family protein [Parcubacteria group bacterium Gr01-1014_38]|nr:MAG: TatD DNase family protein [Parcubacteria group bacterium Gr01-1014_38]